VWFWEKREHIGRRFYAARKKAGKDKTASRRADKSYIAAVKKLRGTYASKSRLIA
jgi:hypothetical protein